MAIKYLRCDLRRGRLVALAPALLLTACAGNNPPPLYAWGDYPDQTYQYLKGDESSYHENIQVLEEQIRITESERRAVPPGLFAYLGLLYLKSGQADRAVEYFQTEKAAFPESAVFMDFQLKAFQNAEKPAQETPQ